MDTIFKRYLIILALIVPVYASPDTIATKLHIGNGEAGISLSLDEMTPQDAQTYTAAQVLRIAILGSLIFPLALLTIKL